MLYSKKDSQHQKYMHNLVDFFMNMIFLGGFFFLKSHCEFEDSLGNFLLSKYLGASKWKNEVMVIKNTPNENDWPRAILELCQKKKFSL